MFNTLFHYPRVLARHRQGPSAQARERYLTHCADQGAARGTLLRTARELLVIAQRLDITTDQMISTRQWKPPPGVGFVTNSAEAGFAVGEDPANGSSKLP